VESHPLDKAGKNFGLIGVEGHGGKGKSAAQLLASRHSETKNILFDQPHSFPLRPEGGIPLFSLPLNGSPLW
jgi:hypothetical protein